MKKVIVAGLATGLFLVGMAGVTSATPYVGDANTITLTGISFSDQEASSKWFSAPGDAIYTYWSNHWIKYTTYLIPGNYNIGMNVTNHGNLGDPGWYASFQVDGLGGVLDIDASDSEVNHNFINYYIPVEGDFSIQFTWLNDKWGGMTDPDKRDANIQINSVFFDNTAQFDSRNGGDTASIPEPATMLLFGTGLVGIAGLSRRRMPKK